MGRVTRRIADLSAPVARSTASQSQTGFGSLPTTVGSWPTATQPLMTSAPTYRDPFATASVSQLPPSLPAARPNSQQLRSQSPFLLESYAMGAATQSQSEHAALGGLHGRPAQRATQQHQQQHQSQQSQHQHQLQHQNQQLSAMGGSSADFGFTQPLLPAAVAATTPARAAPPLAAAPLAAGDAALALDVLSTFADVLHESFHDTLTAQADALDAVVASVVALASQMQQRQPRGAAKKPRSAEREARAVAAKAVRMQLLRDARDRLRAARGVPLQPAALPRSPSVGTVTFVTRNNNNNNNCDGGYFPPY